MVQLRAKHVLLHGGITYVQKFKKKLEPSQLYMNNKLGQNIIAGFGDFNLFQTYSLYVKNKQRKWVTYFAFSPKKLEKSVTKPD